MPHGKICYLEIPANRAEDAAAFYSTLFGWTVRQRGDGNLAFDDSGAFGPLRTLSGTSSACMRNHIASAGANHGSNTHGCWSHFPTTVDR
jgi:hypothetical protein